MSIFMSVNTDGIESVIDSYLEPGDYDYEGHGHSCIDYKEWRGLSVYHYTLYTGICTSGIHRSLT
jgi:hypothetical protein